jgi:hypothetical protein
MEKSNSRKILVIGVLFLFLGASATLCVSAIGPWSDDFDTYYDGQLLDGGADDGGWICWLNNPAAFGTVTNDNYRSEPYSVDIKGPTDLVHLYGDTTGEWVFTAWQFIPVGQSGGNYGGTYFIMNDVYTDGGADTHWAVQIQFDNINDVVESEFDGATVPLIYGEWVELRVEIDFTTDWFTFYYNDQLLVQKPWTEGVQGLNDGTLCLAALDLYADLSTTVYYDDLSWLPVGEELFCGAGGPYFGEVGEDIQFTGTASGGTPEYTWAWTFGDGGTAAVQNPKHNYTAPGFYNVVLTVTDAASNTATATTNATITEPQLFPVLEIGTITGGFGVKASVKNTGEAAATNVDWTITLDGKLIFLGKSTTDTIASIAVAGEEPIKAGFILGIGKTNIVVSATCDEGVSAEVTKSAFVLGPFVLGVK